MRQINVWLVIGSLMAPLMASSAEAEGKLERGEVKKPEIIIMKPKFVEGEVGKPAIIIIPRASLLDRRVFDKSYHNEILRDLHLSTTSRLPENQ